MLVLTLQVQFSTGFEGLVNEFKGLPHGWRDRLGCKGATVDDLKDLVIEVYKTKLARNHPICSRNIHTIELVLKSNANNRHENSLEMQEHVWRALEREDEGSNCLQNTQSSDTLVVQEIAKPIFIFFGGVPLQKLADNTHVSIAQLLTQRHRERRKLSGEDFDKVLHDIGKSIHINLIGKLEELLHNLWDVLLH